MKKIDTEYKGRSTKFWLNFSSHSSCDIVSRYCHISVPCLWLDLPALIYTLFFLSSGRCTRSDTAMTGEITLRGLVLPVSFFYRESSRSSLSGLKLSTSFSAALSSSVLLLPRLISRTVTGNQAC